MVVYQYHDYHDTLTMMPSGVCPRKRNTLHLLEEARKRFARERSSFEQTSSALGALPDAPTLFCCSEDRKSAVWETVERKLKNRSARPCHQAIAFHKVQLAKERPEQKMH